MNKENADQVEKQIVKHYAGSIAYGTNTPSSDTDFRGIFLAQKKFILTPFFNVREVQDSTEEDTKFYELNQYMKLYLDANPNILESLWVDDKFVTHRTPEYDLLRSHRETLLSTKLAFTYTGYAHNQATRMKNHHGWMDKERKGVQELQVIVDSMPCIQIMEWIKDTFPEYVFKQVNFDNAKDRYAKTIIKTEKYMRIHALQMLSLQPLQQYHFIKLVHNYFPHQVLDRDFSIMDYNSGYELIPYGENIFALVPKENGKCINADGSIHKIDTSNRSPEEIKQQPCLIVKFNKDEYLKSSDNRKNYHQWKENRNSDRAILELENGYDTKHAMHVVRLMRTAKEALSTGEINVFRPDAKELLEIRNGSWTFDEMMQYWKDMENEIREVHYKNSVLPSKPNIKLASKVLMDIRELQWYSNNKTTFTIKLNNIWRK